MLTDHLRELHPDPRDVLVICFGVGSTAHAASLHSSVKTLEVVDLSRPGLFAPERVWLDTFVGSSLAGAVPGLVGRVTVAGRGFDFTDVSTWLRSLDAERFPGVAGTWITSAAETTDADLQTIVTFDSSTGLTSAAVSNRLQERIPEVPG